jgi:hypothetical protein
MKVLIEDSRLAFPALFEAESVGDGEPAYGGRFIIEPNSKNAEKLDKAMLDVAIEKWGPEKGPGILALLIKNGKVAFKHEPYTNKKTGDVYAGYEGMWDLGARTPADKPAPTVFDRSRRPVTARDGVVYGGCYVDASVDIWAQDNTYGRRINASLLGVRFWRKGDAFSGAAPAAADDFAEAADDASDLV